MNLAGCFLVSTAAASNPQFSYATFSQIRDHGDVLDGALGYTDCCGKSIGGGGGARELVDRQFVTGEFFQTLGVSAYRGRLLTPADDSSVKKAAAAMQRRPHVRLTIRGRT